MTLRRSVILISFLISFVTPFTASSVVVALTAIARHFGMNALQVNWVNNAYLLTTAVFLLPLGRLADMKGRRRMLITGIILFGSASLLIAIASTTASLIVWRGVQGLASAMIFSTSVALLISVVDAGERGRIIGVNTAATYVGLSLGPVLGGLATRYIGWRSLFIIPLPFAAAALCLLLLYVRGEWADARGEGFDFRGALIYIVSLVAVVLAITNVLSWKGMGLFVLAAGVSGILVFFFVESRISHPLLLVNLLVRNRIFAFSNLASLINYSSTYAVGILVSLYLQSVKGLPPQKAGLLMLTQPLLQALFSPVAGRLSDRVDARIVASAGMVLCTIGLILFIFLNPASSIYFLVMNLSLLGLGLAFFSSPNTSAIMGAVERKFYGVASSMLATMRMLGQMLSSALFTLMIAMFMGKAKIAVQNAPLFMKSARASFLLFAGLCFAGIFASLARGSHNNANLSPK